MAGMEQKSITANVLQGGVESLTGNGAADRKAIVQRTGANTKPQDGETTTKVLEARTGLQSKDVRQTQQPLIGRNPNPGRDSQVFIIGVPILTATPADQSESLKHEGIDQATPPKEQRKPYSGMKIEDTSARRELDQIVERADNVWKLDEQDPEIIRRTNAIHNTIAEVDGIELINEGDAGSDFGYTCPHFVFGTFFKEEWALPYTELPEGFSEHTISFLHSKGYEFVDEPIAGDVALYTTSDYITSDEEFVWHYGVLTADNKIVTKLGLGPIVKHPLDGVPTDYGNFVYFVRKIDSVVPTDAVAFETYLQQVLRDSAESKERDIAPSEKSGMLSSGMVLEQTPIRATIDGIFDRIDKEMKADNFHGANSIANSLSGVGDVEILGEGNFRGDYTQTCEAFVFGLMLRERWALSRSLAHIEFAKLVRDKQLYLQQKGYEMVEGEPAVGDIVVYGSMDEQAETGQENTKFKHFGILGPKGKVVSQFGLGPVLRHPVDAIPSKYGDYAYFFRKIGDSVIPEDTEGFEKHLQLALQERVERMRQDQGNRFLKNKYELQDEPEVDSAVTLYERLTDEPVSNRSLVRIQIYLDRFRTILDRKDPADRERGLRALKRVLLDKFSIKKENIPPSYWRSQERIIREQGLQGDYNQIPEADRARAREEVGRTLVEDQRASLEQWIDYLASPESSYMSDQMKYWVFRSVVGLQEYDNEKKVFPARSKGTVKMFPDINYEALKFIITKMQEHQGGKLPSYDGFVFDLTDDQKREFGKYLEQANFAKLYGFANEHIRPIPEHSMQIIEGEWRRYGKYSDPSALVEEIRGRGTSWCTAGRSTAAKQLQAGGFHVFFTKDDDGNPTIPRIAIRMEGDKIAEIRGIAPGQNLDEFMGDEIREKLKEFPDGDTYFQKEADMRRLTTIEKQMKAGEELSLRDLSFLYEMDVPVQGFGQTKDPRIKELREARNLKEDLCALVDFVSEPSQVAETAEEIDERTKVYVGPLTQGIFKKLLHVEHIYTSFPDTEIKRTVVTIGGKSATALEEELRENGLLPWPSYKEEKMLRSDEFKTLAEPLSIQLVRLHVRDLGVEYDDKGRASTYQVSSKARNLGLVLCPSEVGPQLRLQHFDPSKDEERLAIAMKSIVVERFGRIFALTQYNSRPFFSSYSAHPVFGWRSDDEIVFSMSTGHPEIDSAIFI